MTAATADFFPRARRGFPDLLLDEAHFGSCGGTKWSSCGRGGAGRDDPRGGRRRAEGVVEFRGRRGLIELGGRGGCSIMAQTPRALGDAPQGWRGLLQAARPNPFGGQITTARVRTRPANLTSRVTRPRPSFYGPATAG